MQSGGTRTVGVLIAGALLLTGASLAFTDSPTAIQNPQAFRESITEENLRAAGLDPEKYEVDVPLHRRLSIRRETVRAGSEGTFSLGTVERTKDIIQLSLNSRGTMSFTRDFAREQGPRGLSHSESEKQTMALTQGFGGGTTAGEFSFVRDTDSANTLQGFTRSTTETAKLNLGLGRDFALSSALTTASKLNIHSSQTQKFDLALTRPGAAAAMAEFHETESTVNGNTSTVTAMAFRAPTIELSGRGTLNASHARTNSSVKGSENITSIALNAQPTDEVTFAATHVDTDRDQGVSTRVTTLNLNAKPSETVSVAASHTDTTRDVGGSDSVSSVTVNATPIEGVNVTASHTDSDRAAAADTAVTTIGSQVTVLPDTTISASFSDTDTTGVGIATLRSLTVAHTPSGGEGLGATATYTTLGNTGAHIDPTVDLKLAYTTTDQLQFTGMYHDEHNRPEPEMGATVQIPLFGADLGFNVHEYSYDAAKKTVHQQRVWNAEVARPIVWGLSGKIGYSLSESLVDPTEVSRVRIGLGGENPFVGKLDVNYETGNLRTASGNTPNGSIISVGVTRPIWVADVSVSAKRTLPPGSSSTVKPQDEVHLDVKATW